MAQQASLDPREDPKAFQAQMILNLLPLARLNRQTLWSLLEARYRVQRSGDGKEFLAEVLYPMPIWIPMLRKVLGRPLVPSFPQGSPLQGLDLERLLGPLPAAPLPPPQVRWVRFTGRVFNEGYRSQDHAPLLP